MGLREVTRYARTLLPDNGLEYLVGELFALIMADDRYLDALFVAEVFVIMHFARDEGIGSGGNGLRKQEST